MTVAELELEDNFTAHLLSTMALGLLSLGTLATNSLLVCLLVLRRRSLQWRSSSFVAALAGSDLMGAVVLMAMAVMMVTQVLMCGRQTVPNIVLLVLECEMTASMIATTLLLLTSSLCQLYAITHPIRYQVWLNY